MLVGWSHAGPLSEAPAGPSRDIALATRAIVRVLGGRDASPPRHVPSPLADLLAHACAERTTDARELSKAVLSAATKAFGPPSYHPFTMQPVT